MTRKLCFFILLPFLSLFAREGLEYRHIQTGFQSIHTVEIDPSLYEIKPVKASTGRESVLSMSTRHGAVAAINGGFFFQDGRASGALKIKEWFAFPTKPRGSIGWDAKTQVPHMDRLIVDPSLGHVVPLLGSVDWKSLDYIVGGTPLLVFQGVPMLDMESEQTIPTFLSHKHARTAVGLLPNGHWLFVVVDKVGFFDGMTAFELRDLMGSLGCVDALNLDGGGSSTLIYEGVTKNSPRGDKDEDDGKYTARKVSNAIIVQAASPSF